MRRIFLTISMLSCHIISGIIISGCNEVGEIGTPIPEWVSETRTDIPDEILARCINLQLYHAGLTADDLTEINALSCRQPGIQNLTGLNNLTQLSKLQIDSSGLNNINLDQNPLLKSLELQNNNQLSAISVSNSPSFKTLVLSKNTLANVTIADVTTLNIKAQESSVQALDLSASPELAVLKIEDTSINSVLFANNNKLDFLVLDTSPIPSIDLSQSADLTNIYIDNHTLSDLDLSNNLKLVIVSVAHGPLETLELNAPSTLTLLHANFGKLSQVDVSNHVALVDLHISNNQLNDIVLTNTPQLSVLDLSFNLDLLTIDLSSSPALTSIRAEACGLINLDLSQNLQLKVVSLLYNELQSLNLDNNTLLQYLALGSGYAQDAPKSTLNSLDISSLTELTKLNVQQTNLSQIDLSNNLKLIIADLSGNLIETFTIGDPDAYTQISGVQLEDNPLTQESIDKADAVSWITH
ncbi:Internalin-J [BD1-7 clade bacterium]|uniref:Internalin-J n=1 Tax=BD1-7 clade bacterium TaxID=2029982 RepID=A0A5S9P8E1_9GAMM|nr:Internalin-J [BD1-7 clade bacterium]